MALHPLNGLSLCAGVAGIDLGLHLAIGPAYRTVCYVEREAYPAAVLAARMGEAVLAPAPVWDDLPTFDGRRWRGCVDIVSAGYPCQPFSCAGKRRGLEDDRWIWPDIARIVAEVEPRLCFFENVPGHLRLGFPEVLADLAGLGFDAEWDLFSARGVGAPHLRRRLFILAHRLGPRLEGREGERGDDGGEREAAERGGGRVVADSGQPDLLEAPSGEADDEGGGAPPGAGEDVGDSTGARRKTRRRSGHHHSGTKPGSGSERVWPLGPDCPRESWTGPQPAVRRGSDGLLSRLDRLRALGNGVVPLAAAHAFRTLAARAGLAVKERA